MIVVNTFEQLLGLYRNNRVPHAVLFHMFEAYDSIKTDGLDPPLKITGLERIEWLVSKSEEDKETLMSMYGGALFIPESTDDVSKVIEDLTVGSPYPLFDDVGLITTKPRYLYIFSANNNAGGPSYIIPEVHWTKKLTEITEDYVDI